MSPTEGRAKAVVEEAPANLAYTAPAEGLGVNPSRKCQQKMDKVLQDGVGWGGGGASRLIMKWGLVRWLKHVGYAVLWY